MQLDATLVGDVAGLGDGLSSIQWRQIYGPSVPLQNTTTLNAGFIAPAVSGGQTGKAYIGTRPSPKRIARLCSAISEMTSRRWYLKTVSERVTRLNQMLAGWANYFHLGPVSPAYRAIDAHVRFRLRQWLFGKHQIRGRGRTQYPAQHLYETLGVIRLVLRTRDLPWAKT